MHAAGSAKWTLGIAGEQTLHKRGISGAGDG
jgi:hypothetical protein